MIAMTHPGVSADYPGYAVRRVNAALGENVITMFAQGCSGNINADHVAGGHAHAEAVGNELGEAVLVALKSTTPIRAKAISLRTKTIMLNLHLPDRTALGENDGTHCCGRRRTARARGGPMMTLHAPPCWL
ncbi:MAG: hypothetical protein VCF25_16580 [Candidatus Poribacteria bacterium]